jgi:hypothetical protein
VLLPFIGPRLHGWLDDLVVVAYLLGAHFLGLHGLAFAIAAGGAVVHFLLTRCTQYPQGTWPLVSFRAHAFIELGEGLAVLVAASTLLHHATGVARVFLSIMGALQFGAFAFSDYRPTAFSISRQSRAV